MTIPFIWKEHNGDSTDPTLDVHLPEPTPAQHLVVFKIACPSIKLDVSVYFLVLAAAQPAGTGISAALKMPEQSLDDEGWQKF